MDLQEPAPFSVTRRAARRIAEILAAEAGEAVLRVAVTGGGCSGFQYSFALDDARADDDVVIVRDGATVLVDPMSLEFLKGAELDFVDDLIGAAFKSVVDAFVANIITPLIAAIVGKPDFSALSFTINKSRFNYGNLINQIISFLIIAAVIYFLIVVPMNALAEMRARRIAAGDKAAEPEAKAEDIQLLEQIRDLLQQQGRARTR